MGQLLVTGFKPFAILTSKYAGGNPSEAAANLLAKRYPNSARVRILDVDKSCLKVVTALAEDPAITGIVMFGADILTSAVVMELEGAVKDGVFSRKKVVPSPAALALKGFAEGIGVESRGSPVSLLVYWCLQSYGAALAVANRRNIPCIFLHVNALRHTIHVSSETHVAKADALVNKMMGASL